MLMYVKVTEGSQGLVNSDIIVVYWHSLLLALAHGMLNIQNT